jgi:archaeosine-15-forming tRNA-guanine transglycosylase
MILVVDNYDSFTWNLVQYLAEMGEEVRVIRNDEWTVSMVARCATHSSCSEGARKLSRLSRVRKRFWRSAVENSIEPWSRRGASIEAEMEMETFRCE